MPLAGTRGSSVSGKIDKMSDEGMRAIGTSDSMNMRLPNGV
jgi:hypothetical protein